jgi:ABC-type transport system involved in multi-copper enzyme maturation permease subunit
VTTLTKRRRWHLDWPLLGKELLEQAARKQMYILRVAYAVLLFGAFCFYYLRHLGQGPVLVLGRGLGPFSFLVGVQFAAIFLFLPPLMAGAIAQEKERDTLGLLFLTDLTPWELVLQKYVGRLIPMLTLLFLSLPLLAVAYSLGGVSIGMLCSSAATLFLTCLAVGALALECSVHQTTTFSALVRCWGLCLLFAICCGIFPLPFWLMRGVTTPMLMRPSATGGVFIVPLSYTALAYLLPTMLFLLRARQILESRAFVQRRNPFSQQFKLLDQYWRDLRKLVRALLRKRDMEANAIAKQVLHRQLGATAETREWSLGGFLMRRMQVPNLLAFSIILGFIVLIVLFFNLIMDPKSAPFFVVVGGVWILALLTIPIQSANAVASERMNERLGPLLTTPLTGAEILNEWLAPVRRWIQFLARPLIVLFAVEAFVKYRTHNTDDPRWSNVVAYLGISVLTVWIYPRLVQWSCLWIGLRIKSQIRAMMTAFFAVAAWCFIPLPASGFLLNTGLLSPGGAELLALVSPITIIRGAETLGAEFNPQLSFSLAILIFCHFAAAAGLIWWIRRACLTNADRYLGRI